MPPALAPTDPHPDHDAPRHHQSIPAQEPEPVLHLCWPATAVQDALTAVDLWDTWLERELERQLQRQHPHPEGLDGLWQQWFGNEAESLFLQRRTQLERVQLSLLELENSHLAQELWFRLHSGEADIPELLHHGTERCRVNGGRLGPLALCDLSGALGDPAAALISRSSAGDLLPPLPNAAGNVLLLRIDQRWPAVLDAATRRQLLQELYQTWRARCINAIHDVGVAPGQTLQIPLPSHP